VSGGAAFGTRRLLVLGLLATAATGLLARAVDLQLNQREFLERQGDARFLRVVEIPATRGKILDRNRQPLAISTPVESVWAHPRELAAERGRWPELGRVLGLDEDALHRLIARRIDREFVWLERHVTPELAERVRALRLPGIYLQPEYRRYYPAGEVTSHVVGFTNVDDVGQEGLELAYDDWLRGGDGAKRVIRDRYGRVVEEVEYIRPPEDGGDLMLSIDRRIQYLAYRALKEAVARHGALGGSVVVLDPLSGEILAMANQPAYNPNKVAERVGERSRNRAVTDVFEPGSTIKPFTVAAALASGRFEAHSTVDTSPGFTRVGRHRVEDLRNYGVIDVATVIKKSSNVGATRIALALPAERLWATLAGAGFGALPGSGFPGESSGILTHFGDWPEIQHATMSFGYGLSVTALQLARGYAVLASDGLLAQPTFLRSDRAPRFERVLPAEVAREVRGMLEAVVSADGTGSRARIGGYRVAGKTGTVRKPVAGGYAEDRYVSSFAGMAPASAPRLVAVVTIDEPQGERYYGGQVAAPVFAEVMGGALRTLGIPPDGRRPVPAMHLAEAMAERGLVPAETREASR